MSHAEQLLAEYRVEAQTTRKFLSRLPEDRLTWRPHEKSMTAGQLAYHIATAPAGIIQMALKSEFRVADIPQTQEQPASVKQVMDAFEQSVAAVEELLPTIADEQMQQPWRLVDRDTELLVMPRTVMLRTMLFNHIYHHRGQFGVYLRLVGAKVPSAYGPSGDELPDFLNT
jgi:uncharacterized damage-inducible protein DinB